MDIKGAHQARQRAPGDARHHGRARDGGHRGRSGQCGDPFRTDLNVMLASGTNIQGQMEQVDTDLGYTWDSYTDPNSVRIGVNWGYTSSQLESQLDPELMVAIAAFFAAGDFHGVSYHL